MYCKKSLSHLCYFKIVNAFHCINNSTLTCCGKPKHFSPADEQTIFLRNDWNFLRPDDATFDLSSHDVVCTCIVIGQFCQHNVIQIWTKTNQLLYHKNMVRISYLENDGAKFRGRFCGYC